MPQYHIDSRPYLYEAEVDWEPLWEFIRIYGTEIDVVNEVFSESDLESRDSIHEFLTRKPEVFQFTEPKIRTVSMAPFLKRSIHPSVVYTYDFIEEMIKEIKNLWLLELKETAVTNSFVVRNQNTPILLFGFEGLILKSDQPFINSLNKSGFRLKPWKINFNEIIYGLPQ